MKLWCDRKCGSRRIACIAQSIVVCAVATDAGANCDQANELIKLQYFDEARAVYQSELVKDGGANCAREGLVLANREEAKQQLAVGKQLQAAGEWTQATERFSKALALDVSNSNIVDAIKQLNNAKLELLLAKAAFEHASGNSAAAIETLASAQERAAPVDDDALARISRLAERIRSDRVEAPILARIASGDYAAARTRYQKVADDYPGTSVDVTRFGPGFEWSAIRSKALTVFLFVIEVLAIPLLFFFALSKRKMRAKQRPILVVKPFGSDQIGENIGAAVSRTIESAFNRLASNQSESSVELRVEQQVKRVEIPAEIQELAPAITWIDKMLELIPTIWPRRSHTVGGESLYSKDKGAGLSVRLAQSGSFSDGFTFWESDFGPVAERDPDDDFDAGPHYQLAEYVATWMFFELGTKVNLLGTGDWRAYVSFQAGLFAEDKGDRATARDMYVNALRIDAALHAARLNVSLLARREQYELVLNSLSYAATHADRLDPTRYKALYSFSAINLEIGKKNVASEGFQKLLQDIRAVTKSKVADTETQDDRQLREYLSLLEPLVISANSAADLLLRSMSVADAVRPLDTLYASPASPKTNYNLGCAYALAAKRIITESVTDPQLDTYIDRAIRSLAISFLQNPRMIDDTEDDKTLEFFLSSQFDHNGKTLAEHFAEIVALVDDREDSKAARGSKVSELSKLKSIGRKYAKRLSDNDIETLDQLIIRCLIPASRARLAGQCRVGEEKLRQWGQTADLLRIVGLGLPDANLLNAAGLFSLDDIRAATAAVLTTRLADWAKSTDQKNEPSLAMVTSWIADASQMKDKLA